MSNWYDELDKKHFEAEERSEKIWDAIENLEYRIENVAVDYEGRGIELLGELEAKLLEVIPTENIKKIDTLDNEVEYLEDVATDGESEMYTIMFDLFDVEITVRIEIEEAVITDVYMGY